MREYTPGPKAVARALALLKISGDMPYVHYNLRYWMKEQGLIGDNIAFSQTLTEKGDGVAITAVMWKSHEALVAAGFELDKTYRAPKPGSIFYGTPRTRSARATSATPARPTTTRRSATPRAAMCGWRSRCPAS